MSRKFISWPLVLCFILFPVFLLGQTVNTAKIVQIEAKRDVVLSFQGKPIPPRLPIWQQENGPGGKAGSSYPAAFLLRRKHPAALEVTVHIPGLKPGVVYSLEGLSPGKIPLFSGNPVKVQDETREIMFTVVAQYLPEGFFKISGQHISWQVTKQDTTEVSPPLVVPLELYWIYSDTYQFLQKGIPVERLREIAEVCDMTGNIQPRQLDTQNKTIKILRDDPQKPAMKWVIASIINHCFHRAPVRYNIWSGTPGFTIIPDREERITLLISSYLNAMKDVEVLCNCYDQAAILQYYLHVIGIQDVKLCYMDPFGYLEMTRLIGWGECNNPFFASNYHLRMVNDKNPNRTAFGNHMFCLLERDNTIVDACAGPHLGDQSPRQYVKSAVDNTFPKDPHVNPGTSNNITYLSTIVHHDFITNIKSISDRHEFIHNYDNNIETNKSTGPGKYVVHSWPDPRENPLLPKNEWKLFFEQLVPGINGAMKIWKLRKHNTKQAIDIYLYISSSSSEVAQNHFVKLTESHSHHGKPFTKGHAELGDFSAMSTIKVSEQDRMFWVNNNVVFDFILRNITFESEKSLYKWFDKLAEQNLKDSLEDDLPSTKGVTCSNPTPRVGETVTVKIEPQSNLIYDFTLNGDALKLIEITGEAYIFRAHRADLTTLTLVVVNKHTLLSASKTFDIYVHR